MHPSNPVLKLPISHSPARAALQISEISVSTLQSVMMPTALLYFETLSLAIWDRHLL
jgi:hypothetical protein